MPAATPPPAAEASLGVPDAGASGDQAATPGPHGPGWIVQISGHHYHNGTRLEQGAQYVRTTLIENLRNAKVKLPAGNAGKVEEVTLQELGVSYPVLVNPLRVEPEEIVDPNADIESGARTGAGGMLGGGLGRPGMAAGGNGNATAEGTIKLQRFDFVVQFCWQPKTATARHNAKKAKEQNNAPAAQP